MIFKILSAWCLVAATVTIHTLGLAIVLGTFFKLASANNSYLKSAWRLCSFAWWVIVIHMVEIAIWGLFYWWQDCFPDAESAFYFAGVTYTTIGYGDLLLSPGWRMFGPVEGLTGILMCGLSTAAFFAVVSHLHKMKIEVGKH